MSSNKTSLILLFVVLLIFLNGCPCPSYSPHPTISSLWYDDVSNELYVIKDNHILVFNNISTANGHISPARIISPPVIYTQMVYGGLSNMWLDRSANQLFVTSAYTNSILVFTDTSIMNGNVAPARVISGTTTELVTPPTGLWLDSISDQLYVECGQDGILVFTDATTANGNVAPARSIIPTTNGFYPIPFWLDSASDQLYLTSVDLKGRISILAFTDASTINGDVAPSRVIYP